MKKGSFEKVFTMLAITNKQTAKRSKNMGMYVNTESSTRFAYLLLASKTGGVSHYFCGQIKWVHFNIYYNLLTCQRWERENGVTWKTSLRIQRKSINGILNSHPLIDLHSHIDGMCLAFSHRKSKNVAIFPRNPNSNSWASERERESEGENQRPS